MWRTCPHANLSCGKISPHDRFFSTGSTRGTRDKYQVSFSVQLVKFLSSVQPVPRQGCRGLYLSSHSKLPTASSLIFYSQHHPPPRKIFNTGSFKALFLIAGWIGRLNTVEHVFPLLVTFITRSQPRNFISSPLMDFTKRSPDLIRKFHPLGHQ